MLGVRKWGIDGHCMRLGGWLVRTGTGLDAATLHSERIVLTATVTAADGGEETDHGDDWSRHAMHAGSQACRHMLFFPTRIRF